MNSDVKRIIKRIIIGSIILAIISSSIKFIFKIPDDVFYRYYRYFGIALIILLPISYIILMYKFAKDLESIAYLLEEKKYEEYIEKLQGVKAYTNFSKNAKILNESAVLGLMGKFEEAYELSKEIDTSEIDPSNKLIHYSNQLEYLMELGRNEEAKALYNENKEFIDKTFEKFDTERNVYSEIKEILDRVKLLEY